jgi:hypothetical protein
MSMRRLNSQKKTFTTPVALAVMVILVFCQLFYYHAADYSTKKEIKTEQQDDQSQEKLYISQPSSSLPSSTHVELNQTLIFLFEIVFENKRIEKRDLNVSLPVNRFFKTLFDGVISPNAP